MLMPVPDPVIISQKKRLVERLRKVLPANAVIDDVVETRAYECDALTAYRCPPMIAVLPSSTREVSEILRICHEESVPVVPRGSGTSLAGGALPTADCGAAWIWNFFGRWCIAYGRLCRPRRGAYD